MEGALVKQRGSRREGMLDMERARRPKIEDPILDLEGQLDKAGVTLSFFCRIASGGTFLEVQ